MKIRLQFVYKILFLLIFMLIVTMVSISWLWYGPSKKMVVSAVLDTTNTLLEEKTRNLQTVLEEVDYVSRVISLNNRLVARCLGNKWDNSYLRKQADTQLNDYIDNIYVSKQYLQSIHLSNGKGDYVSRGSRVEDEELIGLLETKYRDADANGTRVIPYGQVSDNWEIMLVRDIRYYNNSIGYSAVSISYDTIEKNFRNVFPENTILAVYNQYGDTLYSNGNYHRPEDAGGITDTIEQGGNIIEIDGEKWLVTAGGIEDMGIWAQARIPLKDILMDVTNTFRSIFITILAAVFVLGSIMYILARWLGRNITLLAQAMERFSSGDMDTEIAIRSNDEFSVLGDSFNQMTQNIRQLLWTVRQKEKEKVELQIKALQGQINLHFLFNTLNTIKNLCYVQRVTNVEKLVEALMELLHISMDNSGEWVTLETEMNYISRYLEIYKYKSLDDILCYIEMDDEVKDCHVLKFLVQPIFENSIIHGLEGRKGKGIIHISAARKEEALEIAVKDNGRGFDVSKRDKFNSIGLKNIEERIRVHFGEDYGLKLESIEGISTTVTIRIPYIKGEGIDTGGRQND